MEPSRKLESVRSLSVDRFRPEGLSTPVDSALCDASVQAPKKTAGRGRLLVNHRSVNGGFHARSHVCVQLAAFKHVQRIDLSDEHCEQSVRHPDGRTSGTSVSLWCSESFQRFHSLKRVCEQDTSAALGSSVSLDSCLPSRLFSLAARKNVEKERFWHCHNDEVVTSFDAYIFHDACMGF